MRKRRLLLITARSLFGSGAVRLLEAQGERFVIEKAPDINTALRIFDSFHPDVVVYFKETEPPEEEFLLQDLVSRHHTRVICCTLRANQLTVYDKTRIDNATVEDLISAALK